jgi:adenylate cyclase
LFAYVTLHLVNHALLNVSVATADAMLRAQKAVWQAPAGTALLYGALVSHAGLGVWSLYVRRHAGWRAAEAWQILLGLSIPAMLANHIAVTRAAWTFNGLNKGYVAELDALWVGGPGHAPSLWGWLQVAVLVVAWAHACLGLRFLLRLRRWWPAWQAPLLAAALILPTLALLGFAAGGREVARALADPAWRLEHLPAAVTGTASQKAWLAELRNGFLALYAGSIALALGARLIRSVASRRGMRFAIHYPSRAPVLVPAGLTVLDVSQRERIPHASVCGGRGRCSTCRVLVLQSAAELPHPTVAERSVLERIGADPNSVRLACQLRPAATLAVVPLIPPAIAAEFIPGRDTRIPGDERFLVAMVIDLRGSTGLAERRLPFDSVFLLGRFIAAASNAVVSAGGRPVQFLGDGLLALFALDCPPEQGCRQALDAVHGAAAAFAKLSPLFGREAGAPLRYGIGVQCGRAIVGEIGFGTQIAFTALGDTVNVAHRLQDVARDHDVGAVISEDVFKLAGVSGEPSLNVEVRGRSAPVAVRLVAGIWAEQALMGRSIA